MNSLKEITSRQFSTTLMIVGNVQHSGFILGDNAVAHEFPLNQKQRLVAEEIVQGALAWRDHPYDIANF
jgi:hypothetical protein